MVVLDVGNLAVELFEWVAGADLEDFF